MSKTKVTRSSIKSVEEAKPAAAAKVQALRKVFYIPQKLLDGGSLCLERFHHPGKGKSTWFITNAENQQIMEVLEFVEPRRSWLMDNEVCSNGRLYLATPIDVTFLVLHHLRKHCTQKALALESICDAQDSSTMRLLTTFVSCDSAVEQLRNVADVKTAGDAGNFYKYNAEKTLAWLSLKTRCVAHTLRRSSVHCGHSALSQNYTRSETLVTDEKVQEIDYLRMACDIVGGYIDLELHEELKLYLEIPPEVIQSKVTADKQMADGAKRKSSGMLNSGENKKLKLDDNTETAATKLKNSSLLDESVEEDIKPIIEQDMLQAVANPTPLKERPQTAKEKARAKGAKGTKSIASFFKK